MAGNPLPPMGCEWLVSRVCHIHCEAGPEARVSGFGKPRYGDLRIDGQEGGDESVRRVLSMVGAVLVVAAACDGSATVGAPTPNESSEIGDVVIGVVFTEPLDLDELRDWAAEIGASLVAVWRVEAVCMPDLGGPPGTPPEPRSFASAFAYVDAGEIKAIRDQGPPATDGGWSSAMRSRFVEEWHAAQEAGVLFAGAALVMRDPAVPLPHLERSAILDSYRTDGTNTLYLHDHEKAFAVLFPAPSTPDC